MVKDKNSLAFPETGDFYRFLPQIFRNQDGGILFAFCELLRQSHSTAKEYSRNAWLSRDPDQIGKFISDHFGESAVELEEFVQQVSDGTATLDNPPSSLRDSANMLKKFRELLNYAGQSVGSGVPLEMLPDLLSRRIVKMAKVRHRTRGTKWLSNNIGRILGIGDVRAIEWWARSGVTDVDDLSENPDLYPQITDLTQSPLGSSSWNSNSFDSGEAGVIIYDPISIDPESPLWFQTQVNSTSPIIQISGVGRNAPLKPGVYHLSFDRVGNRSYVDVPYLDGVGSVRISSFQAGANRSLSVDIGIWDGTKFKLKVTGPRSSFKFKSSTYSLLFYLDFISGASMLDIENGNIVLSSLSKTLGLLMTEDFFPATRRLKEVTAGVGMRDPVLYAPIASDNSMFVSDPAGVWYHVIALGDGLTILVEATLDQIANAQLDGSHTRWGLYAQWDEVRQQMVSYCADITAGGPVLKMITVTGNEGDRSSDLIRTNFFYLWCHDGELITSQLPPPSDSALLGSLDNNVPHGTEAELATVAFGERPRDTLSKFDNKHLDGCDFYIDNRWGETPDKWVGWLGNDNGSDIRYREATIIEGLDLPIIDRSQTTERKTRHNDLTANILEVSNTGMLARFRTNGGGSIYTDSGWLIPAGTHNGKPAWSTTGNLTSDNPDPFWTILFEPSNSFGFGPWWRADMQEITEGGSINGFYAATRGSEALPDEADWSEWSGVVELVLGAGLSRPVRARLGAGGNWQTTDLGEGANEGSLWVDGLMPATFDPSGPFRSAVAPGFPTISGLFKIKEVVEREATISSHLLTLTDAFIDFPDRVLIKSGSEWQILTVDAEASSPLSLRTFEVITLTGSVPIFVLLGTVASPGGGIGVVLRFPVLMSATVIIISEDTNGVLSLTTVAATGREWSHRNPESGPRSLVFISASAPAEFEYYLASESLPITLPGTPMWKVGKDLIQSSHNTLTPICYIAKAISGDVIWWDVYGVFGTILELIIDGITLTVLETRVPTVEVDPSVIAVDVESNYPMIPATFNHPRVTRIRTSATGGEPLEYDGDPWEYDGDPMVYSTAGSIPSTVTGSITISATAIATSRTTIHVIGVVGHENLLIGDFLLLESGSGVVPARVSRISGISGITITLSFDSGFTSEAFNLNHILGSSSTANLVVLWRRSGGFIRHIRKD